MSDLSLVGREEDDTSSVADSQHTYTSLMPAPVRDRIVPYNSQSISSYLNARPSTHGSSQASSFQGSRFSLLDRHRSRHNGRRKISSSSSSSTSRRTEEVIHRFKKLQICVAVLCIANVVTVAIFLLTHPKLSPFFSDDDDFFTTGDGQPKTFKLCTMCQPLEAKVGFNRIIDDIRSEKYPKFCCFRRVDQLLKLFDGYAEQYVDDEVYKVRQEMSYNISKAKPAVSGSIPQVMHVFYSNTNGVSDKSGPLTWETSGGDIILEGLKMQQRQHLKITKDGYYYIYNHLEMKAGATSRHYLIKNFNNGQKKLMERKMQSMGNSVSEFQGVFQLRKGDTVSIFATESDILPEGRKNYFGAFMLEK